MKDRQADKKSAVLTMTGMVVLTATKVIPSSNIAGNINLWRRSHE